IHGYEISRNAQNALPEMLSDTLSGGSLQKTYAYNGFAELTETQNLVNNQNSLNTVLTRNALGRIIGKQETLSNNVINNYVYSYNDKRQLIQVEKNGVIVEAYDYDTNGNRTLSSNSARGITNQSATYNI